MAFQKENRRYNARPKRAGDGAVSARYTRQKQADAQEEKKPRAARAKTDSAAQEKKPAAKRTAAAAKEKLPAKPML